MTEHPPTSLPSIPRAVADLARAQRGNPATPVECTCPTSGYELCPSPIHHDNEWPVSGEVVNVFTGNGYRLITVRGDDGSETVVKVPSLTTAQLAAADVEVAAHHLSLAYEALNRAKERVESSLLQGRLTRAGRATAGALGAIHAAQYAIRGGHHK